MKQTITMMGAFMVALLLVSGFIVMGSMQQAQQLQSRSAQLTEAREKLAAQIKANNELTEKTEALTLSLQNAANERDGYKLRLNDAILAIEEANGAVSQQALEKDTMASSLTQQQTLAQALQADVDTLTAERDALSMRVKELEAQEKADAEMQADANKAADDLRALTAECAAFRALLGIWNNARLGNADVTELEKAQKAFGVLYPKSLFVLPGGEVQAVGEASVAATGTANVVTVEPTVAHTKKPNVTVAPTVSQKPTVTEGSTAPTVSPKPTATTVSTATPTATPAPTWSLPLRTFVPVVTLAP